MKRKPRGFWKNETNHRKYMDWSYEQLGLKSMDDWYQVSQSDLQKYGGYGLLVRYYNSCLSTALQTIYPEHTWMLWKFKRLPLGYKDRLEIGSSETKFLIEWLGEQLSVSTLDDWYRV